MQPRPKILLMITDAGGGHRGSAESLKAAIERRGLSWDVRVVNAYQEVWARMELTKRLFGVAGEDVYNHVLKRDHIRTARMLRWFARHLVRLQYRAGLRLAREFFAREQPGLVVSLMPFVNDIFAEALREQSTPWGLVLTDLMDTRPFMWLTPRACADARFVSVGCTEAAEDARKMGVEAGRLVTSGLIIHPKYFDQGLRGSSPAQAREQMELAPDVFTVLVVMGGYGGPVIPRIVRTFEDSRERWQVVACAGRNEPLRQQLENMRPTLKNELRVFGFTRELHRLMRAVDVVVTKPGPASIFECLAMGTPLVVDDERTMPQETPNAEFLVRHGLGVAVKQHRALFGEVQTLAGDPGRRAELSASIARFRVEDASTAIIEAMTRALND